VIQSANQGVPDEKKIAAGVDLRADFQNRMNYNSLSRKNILGMFKMHNVTTIIMAGGQGSRLYPLTKVRSKPAVPIAGRFRLIDFPISNCIHSGLKKIFILTQFSSESLHRHIFLTYRFDNFTRDFVTILSAQQTLENRDWYQGTADAVRQNLNFIRKDVDLVLVLSGDHLYRMDYRRFIDYHLKKNADITISVYPVRYKKAHQFGVMKTTPSGRIIDFHEKPKEPELLEATSISEDTFRRFHMKSSGRTHLASMGVYLFKRSVLEELLENTDFEDFGREVIPYAFSRKRVYSYFFDGYWEDIGTVRSFFDAHMAMTKARPKFHFYDEAKPIFSHARFLPGSRIQTADIKSSIICEGSIIDQARIEHSIIGVRSRIEKETSIERAVVMGANLYESARQTEHNRKRGLPNIGIGRGSVIRNAIIDRNARIGRNCTLVNKKGLKELQNEHIHIRDGIIVVPKNAVIPAGTTI
jgi:glucose-1-phosphate adenylyltransferase